MRHADKCVQRLTAVFILHIILLTGWLIVAYQFLHITLIPFLGILCQLIMMLDNDIRYWRAEYLGTRGIVLIEMLPIFIWAGIVAPKFPIEALIFAVLQTLYAVRSAWFVDPLTDIKRAANDS